VTLRDLGTDYSPWALNNVGDVVGNARTATAYVPTAVLSDGTRVTLSGLDIVTGISDDRVVVGQGPPGTPVLFDLNAKVAQKLTVPAAAELSDVSISDHGVLSGSASDGPAITQNWRGFVYKPATNDLKWVMPTIPAPPGGSSFLRLNDVNDWGHAVGVQGWVRDLDQVEQPIFYDGAAITSIGPAVFIANGIRITAHDRMRVWYHPGNAPDSEAIYDASTNTLTPFVSGSIVDLNATGGILWREDWPGSTAFVTDGTVTTQLNDLLPSGWTDVVPVAMNDGYDVAGLARLGTSSHGIVLSVPPRPKILRDTLLVRILWGVIQDGGGLVLIGPIPHPIDPWGPLTELLALLPEDLRDQIIEVTERSDVESHSGAAALRGDLREAIERYKRKPGKRRT